MLAGVREQARDVALGARGVGLRLDQRDRRLQRRAVLVEHAVLGVTPTLVAEPVGAAGLIVEQAVAVVVAEVVDPAERGLDRVAQVLEQRQAAAPLRVLGEQAEEQRGRVDGAVVAGQGDRPERRQLPRPQLVDHLARLLLVHGVDTAAEAIREHAERLLGHRGVPGGGLERGDQAVAAEERGEPRDAGGVVGVAVERRAQHLQVQQRALEHAVEQFVVGPYVRRLAAVDRPAL